MPSRLLRPALLAVVLTAALPTGALAADAVLREPADAVVTGATRLVVRVATTAEDDAEQIHATLRDLDGALTVEARHPLCEDAATCSRERADYTIDFDPRTAAPFLPPADAQILANGDYLVRIVVGRGGDAPPQTVDLPLVLSAPGTAPADVQATDDGGEVLLTWDPAPEPDVAGYLVERATSSGWTLVAEVPAEAVSLVDVPGAGVHAYRVVTLRPDGRGATYETVSREVSIQVDADDDPPVAGDQAPSPDDGPTASATDPGATAPTAQGQESSAPSPDGGASGGTASSHGANEVDGTVDVGGTGAPAPGPSATSRTVSEDGDLVLQASDAAPDATGSSATRLIAPALVGLAFVGLAVRVWRRSRPVHRPPA